ncbi:MAG TPA: DUF4202 domain-containing protein [Pseudomonadales bacterium]
MAKTSGADDAAVNDEARYRQAAAAIDARNDEDPTGREPQHARDVLRWIDVLAPQASVALRLAGRAQHMGRWRIPRGRYPEGRAGYLRWRRDLAAFHAEETARLLTGCGYPAGFVDRVARLVRKEDLAGDPEAQTLEDALCLVFIERDLDGFRRRHDDTKLERILRRTWAKMSPAARREALALPLSEPVRELLARSVG